MIVNADDFGYNNQINRAIVDCFQRGYCSSTTIIANMSGFEEACQLIHECNLVNHTGIHLVITEGVPLTDEMRKCRRFCNAEGVFSLSRKKRFFHLTSSERVSLAKEFRAQTDICRRNGVQITHADSHRHAHEEWAIASTVIDVCKEERIPWVRLARNCGRWKTPYNWAYRHILNFRLRTAGLARTKYFGSAKDCIHLLENKGVSEGTTCLEVMVHPGYDERGVLVDRYEGVDLGELVRKLDVESDMQSFSGHRWKS